MTVNLNQIFFKVMTTEKKISMRRKASTKRSYLQVSANYPYLLTCLHNADHINVRNTKTKQCDHVEVPLGCKWLWLHLKVTPPCCQQGATKTHKKIDF